MWHRAYNLIWFQSTPPYGGRRVFAQKPLGSLLVSIHAPVWGATHYCVSLFYVLVVSIHAPVWGATHHF